MKTQRFYPLSYILSCYGAGGGGGVNNMNGQIVRVGDKIVKTKPPEFKICFDDGYKNKYFLVRLKKTWLGLSHTYKVVTELIDFTETIGFKEMPHRFKTQK